MAQEANNKLSLRNENAVSNPVLRRVYNQLEEEYKKDFRAPKTERKENEEGKFLSQKLSKLNKQERKLIGKVYSIISKVLPKDEAETLINKIQEELSK